MLIEFRVKNFRSLRDEQVLSLVASKDKTWVDTHTSATGLTAAPRLLKSAVIYGANASGKSNLIKALQYMQAGVQLSATLQPGPAVYMQFALDAESGSQPSEFEVTFLVDGVRYQYGFAMTPQRIVREYLLVYKAFKPQRWFDRHFDEAAGKDVYTFGPGLKGPKNVWEHATRSDALFLSTAVQLNSEALRPAFNWFTKQLVILNERTPLSLTHQFTMQMLKQDEGRKRICDFLAAADISIADIEVRTTPVSRFNLNLATGQTEKRTEEEDQPFFSHVTDTGKATFNFADESGGTQTMFFLSGPVLDILSKGLTLVVDELFANMHTHLVQALIRLFHRPDSNTGNAQLIFSTHDTSLLDAYGLFRRDQIWFMEKKVDQSSTLYSLSDYSPRKNEARGRGYLQGRYGAVPILSGLFEAPH